MNPEKQAEKQANAQGGGANPAATQDSPERLGQLQSLGKPKPKKLTLAQKARIRETALKLLLQDPVAHPAFDAVESAEVLLQKVQRVVDRAISLLRSVKDPVWDMHYGATVADLEDAWSKLKSKMEELEELRESILKPFLTKAYAEEKLNP